MATQQPPNISNAATQAGDALKKVLEGLPFKTIFCCPTDTRFISPPGI